MMKMLRTLFIILGAIGVADTAFILTRANVHMGTLLPAILGLPLLIIGIFFPWFHAFFAHGFGLFLKWLIIAGYSIYALLLIICVPLISREANADAPAGADAVIILGCGLRHGKPSLTMKYRLDRAIEYLNENESAYAVPSGGIGSNETVSEASAMRDYLIEHGISDSRILMEGASTSTYENFAFSCELIKEKLGPDARVVFVTTDFHVFRSELIAKKMGIPMEGMGAKSIWYIQPNNYMRESLVILQYLLYGRI